MAPPSAQSMERAGVVNADVEHILGDFLWPAVYRNTRLVYNQQGLDSSKRLSQRRVMKLIIAIIQPSRLEAVKAALTDVEVFRLTVMDCQGFGRQKGQTEVYRGREFAANLLRKVQLQIAVNDEFVEPTVQAIIRGGRSGDKGQLGDGKIFVVPLDDCVRIRTGERGGEAI